MYLICILAPSGETIMALEDSKSPMPIVVGQFTPSETSSAIAKELMLMYNNHQSATAQDNVVAFKKEKPYEVSSDIRGR